MADSQEMETETDAGMSSAMHDIRSLASSYQAHQKQDLRTEFQQPASIVDPRVLLLPKEDPNAERWKLATLSLMVLLGLSTAALAVSLNLDNEHVHKSLGVPPVQVLETPAQVLQELPSPPEVAQEPEAFKAVPAPISFDSFKPALATLQRRSFLPKNVKAARKERRVEREVQGRDACDEVACLIGEGGACCALQEPTGLATRVEEPALRPYRLTRAQVMGPMKRISGRVAACFERHDHSGVALVSIIIAPTGGVQSFALETGSEAFQSCVAGHVRKLSFPELRQAFRVSYPFTSKR